MARRVAEAESGIAERATATIEAAAGLWERGFAAAESDVLNAPQLAIIGRRLLLRGETVWSVEGGRVALPAASWDVTGGADPALWRYRLEHGGPSRSRTVTRGAADVAHFRIGCGVSTPWRGVSPLVRSESTAAILRHVERSLRDEHRGPVGSVIPVPRADGDSTDDLAGDIARLAGQVVLGESTAAGWDEGRASAPGGDWRPQRIGPAPSQYTVSARLDVERSILAACGVPVSLVIPTAGADAREGWRRFLHGTLAPVAALVGAELARVGLSPRLDFRELMASDLQGRARAYRQLRDAGMDETEARTVCGFE